MKGGSFFTSPCYPLKPTPAFSSMRELKYRGRVYRGGRVRVQSAPQIYLYTGYVYKSCV